MRVFEPSTAIWRLVVRPFWPWLLAAVVAMAILRAISVAATCWMDSSLTCFEHAKLAAFGWLRFQWVFKYKELIAGMLAVIGGTFAYFAATATINASEERFNREHVQRVESAVAGLLKSLTDVMHALQDTSAIEESLRLTLKISADTLCQASHRGFGIMIISLGRIERGISAIARSGADRNRRESDPKILATRNQLVSDLFIATTFLTSRELSPDPGDTMAGQLAGKEMLELLREQGLPEPDPRDTITAMFDFTR